MAKTKLGCESGGGCENLQPCEFSHHIMRNQCVITSIVDEFHPMITLKQNQVFRNQNLLDVSLPMIILLTKLVSFQVMNFWGLTAGFARLPTFSRAFTIGHICITKNTRAFT